MKTVFFLDDSSEFLALMKLFVERRCGSKATMATSFSDALSKEESVLHSDMAFLDVNLGSDQPSGIDFYRWLREKGYDRPIYFLTGHARNSAVIREIESLEDVSIFNKPLPHQTLQALIG
jgi:ActR/RegA family two-component response regulator